MTHAPNAPSAAHRWMNCPGSIALCTGAPESDSVHSREGTFAHTVAAACLISGHDASTWIGKSSHDSEFTVDAEMAEHIQVYLDAVRMTLDIDGGTLLVEQKVTVSPEVYGTADALIVTPDVLHVFDFKFGRGVFVDEADNEQLKCYALGALKSLKQPPKTCSMHIVQPRCPADRLHRQWECSSAALMGMWSITVREAVTATKQPGAALCPGDWCGFCPVKASCPALRKQALTTASAVFEDLDLVKAAVKPPSPANLSPQQIAVVLAGEELVTKWLKGVNEMAFDMLQRGETIPGFKLVEKRGNRKWKDEAMAQEALKQTRIDPFAPREILSPAQAEKLLTKAVGKSTAEALVEKLAHKPITGSTIVPVSDPRPALTQRSAAFQSLD